MIGVPALYRMMLEHDRLDQYDLSSLKYCFSGGDVLPVEVGKRWQEKFGIPFIRDMVLRRPAAVLPCARRITENPPKSVGRIVNSKKVKVVNPANLEPVATGRSRGAVGIFHLHGFKLSQQSPRKPQRPLSMLDGEKWYRTADIMSMDQDGNLYFVDRTVDTIKHKGYRVSASEIESVSCRNIRP